MKSRFIIFVLLLICSIHVLYAKEQIKPILSNGCSFVYSLVCDDSSPYLIVALPSYESKEIKGNSYSQLNLCDYDKYSDVFSSIFLREENGRLYKYDEKIGKDIVVIDFTLERGDKFTDEDGHEYIVDNVSDTTMTRTYGGEDMDTFKKLELIGVDDTTLRDTWIEGLGSLHRGLLCEKDIRGLQYSGRTFASLGKMLHAKTMNHDTYTFIDSNSIKTKGSQHSLIMNDTISLVYPSSSELGFEFVGSSLHVVGKIYRCWEVEKYFCYLISIINGHDILLYDIGSYWGKQIVFGFHPFNVNVYFPGFEAGEYTIKLVDYHNYEEIVLYCQGNTTAINEYNSTEIQPSKLNKTEIYDLSGHRLTSPPERGIYIQGGKLRMK